MSFKKVIAWALLTVVTVFAFASCAENPAEVDRIVPEGCVFQHTTATGDLEEYQAGETFPKPVPGDRLIDNENNAYYVLNERTNCWKVYRWQVHNTRFEVRFEKVAGIKVDMPDDVSK